MNKYIDKSIIMSIRNAKKKKKKKKKTDRNQRHSTKPVPIDPITRRAAEHSKNEIPHQKGILVKSNK